MPRDLLSSSWRPRRARSTDAQGQERMDVPSQAQKANLPFSCFFCSVQVLRDWMRATSLLGSPIQMLNSSKDALPDTARNKILLAIWASLNPVKLTHVVNHHPLCSSASKFLFKLSWHLYNKSGTESAQERLACNYSRVC